MFDILKEMRIDQILLERERGYCEKMYAVSSVVILRERGIFRAQICILPVYLWHSTATEKNIERSADEVRRLQVKYVQYT